MPLIAGDVIIRHTTLYVICRRRHAAATPRGSKGVKRVWARWQWRAGVRAAACGAPTRARGAARPTIRC